MFSCYTLRCRIPDVGFIRNVLEESASVETIRLEEIERIITEGDLLFVGWDSKMSAWDVANTGVCPTFDILMKRIRSSTAFANSPLILVTEEEEIENNPSLKNYGFSSILTRPLEKDTIVQSFSQAMTQAGKQTQIGPMLKQDLQALTIKCLPTDRVLIQSALGEKATVEEADPESLQNLENLPEIVFVRWGCGYPESKYDAEERQLITSMVLGRIRGALAFQDIPVVLIVDKAEKQRASLTTRFGVSAILTLPLKKSEIRQTIADILRPVGKDTHIDVRVVNPFVEATVHVLKKMADIEVVNRNIILKRDYQLFGEISALINVSGDNIEGAVGITFHDELAHQIVQHMLGEEGVKEITEELINDVLGELANVICGRATANLPNEEGLEIVLSVPTIISGIGQSLTDLTDVPCLSIVFETHKKPFAVQVAVKFTQ